MLLDSRQPYHQSYLKCWCLSCLHTMNLMEAKRLAKLLSRDSKLPRCSADNEAGNASTDLSRLSMSKIFYGELYAAHRGESTIQYTEDFAAHPKAQHTTQKIRRFLLPRNRRIVLQMFCPCNLFIPAVCGEQATFSCIQTGDWSDIKRKTTQDDGMVVL